MYAASAVGQAELSEPVQYVLIPHFTANSIFFCHLHHQRSRDLSLSSVLPNYYTVDDDAAACQGIVKHDVIYTLPRFQNLPLLSCRQ